MIIIGINAYHADASAAIFVDGKLVAATEEERFSRTKHRAGFPREAIRFCLREAGVGFEAVDYFAIGRDPGAKRLQKIRYLLRNPGGSLQTVKDRLENHRKVASVEEELALLSGLPAVFFKPKIKNIEHHRSHLASAFFASGFDEAACMSIDGSGDFSTCMSGVGKGNHIEVLQSLNFPHSLGIFYTAFTQLLGFPYYGDEYKVMGMAPYGKPLHMASLGDVIQLTPDGFFKLNLDYFRKGTTGVISYDEKHLPQVAPMYSEKMIDRFGPVRQKEEELTMFHQDLAASVQRKTEEVIFHMLNHLHKRTGLTRLCIAGGVAQNSVANGKITRNTPFTEVYIPSAGHDAGISMGAALYVQHEQLAMPKQVISSAYTGSSYSNEYIRKMLQSKGIEFTESPDEELYTIVAEALAAGKVVGWVNGRAEFGPRALGARSILADPRRKDVKELLNVKIKRRESFRPFAPSVLEEWVEEFFELDEPVPFMEKVFPIKEDKQVLIPAVTHVDGSGRLQTVNKIISPRYYGLISRFREITGIPILVNTSFNENEPIVNSPEEALACYLRTQMDMLVMENIIIERNGQ